MTTNFEPGIMSAICLPSSGVAVGSCEVQTTIVGTLMDRYCSAVIMLGRRISISCRYMIRFMVSVNPGWAYIARRVSIRSSETIDLSHIKNSRRVLMRSQEGSDAAWLE